MDVTIGCICPPKGDEVRHPEGDTVTLRDRLDFRGAVTVRKAIGLQYNDDPNTTSAETLALLTENYLLFGITGWTVVDEKGKAVPPSRAAIHAFLDDHQEAAMKVGDAADDLYAEQVLLPLLARATASSTSSPDSQTTTSTSAPTDSSRKRPTRSSRSSTSISPTDGTGTITSLPVGEPNSSQKPASAA